MSGRECTFGHHQFDRRGQFEKPERIGDRAALLAQLAGQLILRDAQSIEEILTGLGFLDRVKLFALNIFYESKLEQAIVRYFADQRGNFKQAGALRRHEPTFSCDQLVPPALGAHEDRLKHSMITNGVSELTEPLFVDLQSRLVRIGRNPVDVDFAGNRLRLICFRDERSQPSTQHLFFDD